MLAALLEKILFLIFPLEFLSDIVLLYAIFKVKRQPLTIKVYVVLVFSAEIAESLFA